MVAFFPPQEKLHLLFMSLPLRFRPFSVFPEFGPLPANVIASTVFLLYATLSFPLWGLLFPDEIPLLALSCSSFSSRSSHFSSFCLFILLFSYSFFFSLSSPLVLSYSCSSQITQASAPFPLFFLPLSPCPDLRLPSCSSLHPSLFSSSGCCCVPGAPPQGSNLPPTLPFSD